MLILYFLEEAGRDFVLLKVFGNARCATFVVVCGVHRALGVSAGAERAEIFHITTSELIKFLIRSIPFFRSRFKYCLQNENCLLLSKNNFCGLIVVDLEVHAVVRL